VIVREAVLLQLRRSCFSCVENMMTYWSYYWGEDHCSFLWYHQPCRWWWYDLDSRQRCCCRWQRGEVCCNLIERLCTKVSRSEALMDRVVHTRGFSLLTFRRFST
jgi:hypothetical protein